jgi:tetratricopeptide (TPR) repeat protein
MKFSRSTVYAVLVLAVGAGIASYFHFRQESALLVPLDIPDLRPLLEEKRFAELTQIIEEFQEDYEKDHTKEDYVNNSIMTMTRDYDDDETRGLLKEWEYSQEHSYVPYLVQCDYYHWVGFNRRGEELAADTPARQMEEMRFFMDLSDKKCGFALSMNPKLSVAYATMIGNATATSNRTQKISILRRARAHLEASYRVDKAFLWGIQPQWGGSVQEMERFVEQATRRRPDDVFSKRIEGQYGFLMSKRESRQDRMLIALEYIDNAVAVYPARTLLSERAWILAQLGEHEASMEDLHAALKRYPRAEWENQYLARNLRWTGRYDEAVKKWDELIEWHGDKAMFFQQRGYALWDLAEHDAAESSLLRSLELDPGDKWTWTGLGRLYSYELKEAEKAAAAFERAIEIDPDVPLPYYEMGSLYYWAADKRANEYLQKFLDMCALTGDCKNDRVHFAEEFFECLEPDSGCSWSEVPKENFL